MNFRVHRTLKISSYLQDLLLATAELKEKLLKILFWNFHVCTCMLPWMLTGIAFNIKMYAQSWQHNMMANFPASYMYKCVLRQ